MPGSSDQQLRVVEELALSLGDHTDDPDRSSMWRGTQLLERSSVKPIPAQTTIVGRQVHQYRTTLDALLADPQLEHLDREQVDGELWRLACSLLLDETLSDDPPREACLTEFVAALRRPPLTFDALVQVSGFAVAPGYPLRIGEIRLEPAGPSLLRAWDLWEPGYLPRPQWRGQLIARFEVEAGLPTRALDRATQTTSAVCNELRFALQKVIRARLSDDQLEFEPGWCAVRESGTEGFSTFRPARSRKATRPWGRGVALDEAVGLVNELHAFRRQPRPQQIARIDTALEWLGVARSTPHVAGKLLALTASLEALLMLTSDRRKSASLVLRDTLFHDRLDGAFPEPSVLAHLYDVRSRLTHGERIQVSQEHYWSLLGYVERALSNYLRLAQSVQYGGHGRLLKSLQADSERLLNLRRWIERVEPVGHEDMILVLDSWIREAT